MRLLRLVSAFALGLAPTPALAQSVMSPPGGERAMAVVSRDRADAQVTPVHLKPGRSAAIEFATDEAISFVQLSDQTEIVYNTNAPLDSGQARVIFLRLVEPVPFPGQTRSSTPTLMVTTADRQGTLRTYVFDLHPHADSATNGVEIVPAAQVAAARPVARGATTDTVMTEVGEASLRDIELGLQIAIARGYTASNNPVVLALREVVATARNGGDLLDAIAAQELRLATVAALGQLGLERRQELLESDRTQDGSADSGDSAETGDAEESAGVPEAAADDASSNPSEKPSVVDTQRGE